VPIVCKHLGDAIWECSTKYTFPDDAALGLHNTQITCQQASEGKIYANTCVLTYEVGKETDYEPVSLVTLIWSVFTVFVLVIICLIDPALFFAIVCFGNRGRGGNSSSYARMSTTQ
jgi:hypothetical protein